jgi:beta-barrel assembly-enhancing protease
MNRNHPLWIAALMVAAVSGYTVAASFDLNQIFGVGRDTATAIKGMDEKEEIEVGREVAGRTLGAAPLVPDPALQAYVNRVGRWVASQTERPDLPWHFGVLDTSTINAFAAPGGYVLITRGLYEILDNESQLAGVLGHEIGHIVRRHHVEVMQKSAGISAAAGGLSAAAQARQRGDRAAWTDSVVGTGAEIFARGLDKSAEFEADQIGVVLAARAGYSPYGLIEVLHKLAVRSSSDESLGLLFKTHPAPGERLDKIGEALKPRLAQLPAGREPPVRQIAANVPPPPAPKKPAAVDGARALQQQEEGAGTTFPSGGASGSKGGIGVDPAGVLRGIFGR